LQALTEAKHHEDDWSSLFLHTTGLVFFGTPFRGAGGMDQSQLLDAAQLQYKNDVQPQSLEVLEPSGENLIDLVESYQKACRKEKVVAKTACFYELKATNFGAVFKQQWIKVKLRGSWNTSCD
jgi:hypothetical protein